MANRLSEHKFLYVEEDYSGSFTSDLLEQYKLYVQSAENVSARRVASSRYLLTLNSAIVALYGLQAASLGQGYWMIPIPILGFAVSLLWHQIIKSHSDLNAVKFKIIHELEQHLPAAIYTLEWRLANKGQGKSYRAVTRFEQWIPLIFSSIHAVLLIIIVLANIG